MMKSVMQLLREWCLVVLMFVCVSFHGADSDSGSCSYYFLQQPHNGLACNPWQVIRNRGLVLELPCHIQGPQMSEDLTNVVWYHYKFLEGAAEIVDIDNRKYFNPISSEDIGGGFKQVNFTLNITNVNEYEDLGCYWCQIDVSAFNCSFSFFKSSHFCLLRETEGYQAGRVCASIPINDTMVCVSDMSCDPPPMNVSVTTTDVPSQSPSTSSQPPTQSPTDMESTSSPIATTDKPSETPQVTDSTPQTTDSTPEVTDLTLPEVSSTIEPDTLTTSQSTSPATTSTTPTSNTVPPENITGSIGPTSIVPTHAYSTASQTHTYSSVSPTHTYSTASPTHTYSTVSSPPAPTQTAVPTSESVPSNVNTGQPSTAQIGFYAGLGVCVILLFVILALAAIAVLLCRRKPRKEREAQVGEDTGSSSSDQVGVWRRQGSDSQSTSIINGSSNFPLLSHWSQTGDYSNHGNDHIYTSVRRSPQIHDFTSKGQSSKIPTSGEPSQAEGVMDPHAGSKVVSARPESPETHYYHVLEQPQYYNYDWLSGNGNGREQLLQNQKEMETALDRRGTKTEGSSPKREPLVGVALEDKTGEEKYHWRVIPMAVHTARERLGSGSSLGSRSSRRHLYQRLDQATLDSAREYAKLTIGKNIDASGNDKHT